jgi:hypothetical protein
MKLTCTAALLLFVACAAPLLAQVDAETRKELQLTRQAIVNERKTIVTQTMDLTAEEEAVFWPLYRDWRAKVAGLGDREVKLISDFADKYENMSDADAGAIIDDWVKIEDDYNKLRKHFLKRFRKALPDKKVMQFFQLENKMDAIIEYELAGSIPLAK